MSAEQVTELLSEGYLTVDHVAVPLDVLPETVRCWLRAGKLPGLKLPGGDWRIHPRDLAAFLTSSEVVEP